MYTSKSYTNIIPVLTDIWKRMAGKTSIKKGFLNEKICDYGIDIVIFNWRI